MINLKTAIALTMIVCLAGCKDKPGTPSPPATYPDATLYFPLKINNSWTFDYTKDSNGIRLEQGIRIFTVYKDTALTLGADTVSLCAFDDASQPFHVFNSYLLGDRPFDKTSMFWYYGGSFIKLYEMSKLDSLSSPSNSLIYNAFPFHKNVQIAFYPGFRPVSVPLGNYRSFKSSINISDSYNQPYIHTREYIKSFYFSRNIGIVKFTDETHDNDSLGHGFEIVKTYNLKAVSLK
ncbi:MAG: hypothetical protein H7321_06425 [Bacteroidia bacterium]|nr:hypothetical protein [Bacteroidia bacterium]